jgi:hypothetical protein
MKHSNSKSMGFTAFAFGCAVLVLCLAGPGYCEEDGTALMLQISPVNGGTLNLSPGVHTYDRDAEVTLTAVPNPSYRFVYWLGNVTNATTNTTTVHLDSPKIVIAVFERSQFAFVEFEEGPQGSVGGGGLITSSSFYSGGIGGGGSTSHSHSHQHTPKTNGDVPVPPENEPDLPVPVPEPATIVFMFTGVFSLVKCRYRRAEAGKVHRQTL